MDHSDCDPDICFACKMRYMRENGVAVRIPKDWKGPSLQRRAQKIVEDARAAGRDVEHVGNRWV